MKGETLNEDWIQRSLSGAADQGLWARTLPGVRPVLDASGGCHSVLVDLAGVTFADRAAVEALERAHACLGSDGRQVVVAHPPRLVAWMLGQFGLDHLLAGPGGDLPAGGSR